jgi:hypothetical protein
MKLELIRVPGSHLTLLLRYSPLSSLSSTTGDCGEVFCSWRVCFDERRVDEGAIKAGLDAAQKAAASAADGSIEKATAQTEVMVYSAMARSVGVAV